MEGCVLSCSYCILKSYINSPDIKITKDYDYILSQVNETIDKEKNHILRFGTGELSDSLALDRRYGLNKPLIQFFGEKKKAILELKSKWAYIDHLREYLNPFHGYLFFLGSSEHHQQGRKENKPAV